MQAYKFETTILKNGVIKLPEINNLTNKKVEVFIIEKEKKQEDIIKTQLNTFEEFSKKWRGFLKGTKLENFKDEYTNHHKK